MSGNWMNIKERKAAEIKNLRDKGYKVETNKNADPYSPGGYTIKESPKNNKR